MVVKIDGVRDPEVIEVIAKSNPTYLGFDFRRHSTAYIGEVDEAIYSKIPIKIRRTGIFQDDNPLYILSLAGRFSLSTLQLEGDEDRLDCELLCAEGLEVIKVVNSTIMAEKYEGICNKFIIRNPELLKNYRGKTPLITPWNIYKKENYGVEVVQNELKSEEWINFSKTY